MRSIGAEDIGAIERAIARVETATGVQVVAAIVPRADDYPEAQWRAFALASAFAALVVFALDVVRPEWTSARGLLVRALAILLAGALAALAAQYVPACRRWFVGAARAQREVRQRAEALFLSRELFATPARHAVLILVAELEHRVVVVPDAGYRGRVSTAEWQGVVTAMTPALAAGELRGAFEQGLAALQALLVAKGFTGGDGVNRLSDRVLREDAP